MSYLLIDQITKTYGETRALDEVCLEVARGEFVTLLGPSGCGKSTTLRAVAGLLDVDRGVIAIDGRDVTRVPINDRNIGMVFQNLALFPHMTVAENVAFGLRMRNVPRSERSRRVSEALAMVRLDGFDDRYPHQLSGGQQQRVAIARALVINPGVLLLDEPFSALDRKLREEMQIELRQITRRVGITSIFVTHDQEEALTLSDRVVVMNGGRVEQVGAPDAIYSRPETAFVADFMGARNILACRIVRATPEEVELDWNGVSLAALPPRNQWHAVDQRVLVALRPELVCIGNVEGTTRNRLAGQVAARIDQGGFISLVVSLADDSERTLTVRQSKLDETRNGRAAVGDPVTVSWSAPDLVILRDRPRDQDRAGGPAMH